MDRDKDNIFGCREAKDKEEKEKLDLIDESNKLILDKISFKNYEVQIINLVDRVDDLYMNIYNHRDKLDDQKILDYVNRLADLRKEMEKYIKFCRFMQKSVDKKLVDCKLKMNS